MEQVKKMTIEGTVNVEGKVEINNSSKINNLYIIARRAKDNNDWDSAKKYYYLVLQEDPLSWEATFFLAYFDAIYCKNGELKLKAIKMCNCIESVVNLIHQSNISLKEKVDAYTMIASHVVLISNSLQERAKKFRNSMIGIRAISPTSLLGASKDVKEYRATVAYMISCKFIFSDTLEQYIDEFEEFSELKTLMVNVWKLAIEDTYSLFGKHLSDDVEKIVDKCKKNIHKYTSSTETASDEQLSENNTSTNIISSNINEQNENITITKADTFFGPLSLILGVILTILVILVSKEKSVIGIFGVVPLIFGIITRKKSLYNKDKAIIGIVLGLATIIIGFIKFLTIF